MNLVCSWGGVGTTAVLEYLESIPGYRCNPARGYLNPLKHPIAPPAVAERALFLYGCPFLSLVSLFRRGIDRLHFVNVNGLFPEDVPYPSGNLWELTCDKFGLSEGEPGVWVDQNGVYADRCGALDWLQDRKAERARAEQIVDELAMKAYSDLEDFIAKGHDLFRRYEQWENWSKGAQYPVLMVRYDSLWEHLVEVLDFLKVPDSERSRFPAKRARTTVLEDLDPRILNGLEMIYDSLDTKVREYPSLLLLE